MEASGYLGLRRRVANRRRPSPIADPTSANRKIGVVLFATQGRPEDEAVLRALWTTCPALQEERTVVRIVHVLTVPMTVPLGVCLPEAEEASARILLRARSIAAAAGTAVEIATLTGRTAAEALVDDARAHRASAIIIRLRSRETVGAHVLLSRTVRALLRNAPCPVTIVHLPHADSMPTDSGRPTDEHRAPW